MSYVSGESTLAHANVASPAPRGGIRNVTTELSLSLTTSSDSTLVPDGVPSRLDRYEWASTTSFSPNSIFSQFARECSAASSLLLLSWLSETWVVPSLSSNSYTSVW
jgi:hypothetical protein